MSTDKEKRVFISHSFEDSAMAARIQKCLDENGIPVWSQINNVKSGEELFSEIEKAIQTSEFMIVLLSANSTKSKWLNTELNLAIFKNITVIPILINDCEIPQVLKNYEIIDIRDNNINKLWSLFSQLSVASEIDFSKLTSSSFENMVTDLLRSLSFYDVRTEFTTASERTSSRPDIIATYKTTDPLGNTEEHIYVVEIKYYKQSRPDLKSLHQLANYVLAFSKNARGLLVTNSMLTSAGSDWLSTFKSKTGIEIKVLDGAELQRHLIKHPDLVKKYFHSGRQHA
jgi:hypothetical protein